MYEVVVLHEGYDMPRLEVWETRRELREEFIRSRHLDMRIVRHQTGVEAHARTVRALYPCLENSEIEMLCTGRVAITYDISESALISQWRNRGGNCTCGGRLG